MSSTPTIGICHWDGYETPDKKGELVKGAKIVQDTFGLSTIKIYAGNKYTTTYNDMKSFANIKTLKDLLETAPYKNVLSMGFKTIVIVMYSLNNEMNDDYWRIKGVNDDETVQFSEVSKYLNTTYHDTEFILSNWESDCVINSAPDIFHKKLYADNIVSLINARYETARNYDNVKIALEVNFYYDDIENSITYIIPKVNCDMISYSCYQMLQKPDKLDLTILTIKSFMKPNTELYIGEFGFAIKNHDEYIISEHIKNAINVFTKHNIRLVYYWSLYCNEKLQDGSFNGFGLIDTHGKMTYVKNYLFNNKTYLFIARHGISLANVWKKNKSTEYINTETGLKHNLIDSDLSYDGIQHIKKNGKHFWDTIFSKKSKHVKIYLSPLKRSIRTCLLSMKRVDLSLFKNVNIVITPVVSEYGDSKENKYMSQESFQMYPEYIELSHIVNNINFYLYSEWSSITAGKYDNEFKNYICKNTPNTSIVCITHWGVINRYFKCNLRNFGVDNYVINYET